MCVGLWCLAAVSASAKRMRKLTANAIGGKPVRARQEPDALRVEREIMVFPALAQTYTKKDKGYGLMRALASLCDLWRGAIAERKKSHSLAFDRPRKIWKTWSKAERLSSLERIKRSIIKHIGHSRYLAYGGLS